MPEWAEYRVFCPECRAVFHTFDGWSDSTSRKYELEKWTRMCNHKTASAQPYIEKRVVTATRWAKA